tara:strand:- start:5689 stop:7425 length:1737 start_codon:yes stop_codon:yes gene_type:complete
MTDAPTIREAVEARLAKRYRAEARFRFFGISAIVFAITVLVLLLGSIGWQSISAFTVNELALPVTLESSRVDPRGDRSEESLRSGSYNSLLQGALREQFPEVTERAALRELFGLYTPLNAARLLNRVADNPDLVGQTISFEMPISDHADLYLKGRITESEFSDQTVDATPSSLVGDVSVRADTPVFASLMTAARDDLSARADALEARAGRYRDRAATMEDGDAASRLLADADTAEAQADALRESADSALEETTLTQDLQSRLIEINGGVIRIERISEGGRVASGPALLALESTQSDTEWRIRTLLTPETERRFSDAQIVWTDALVATGHVREGFNRYLFSNADSREPELAGVKGALIGSILTMFVTMTLAVPIGVFTALYLEEFAPKNRLTDLIEVNINNLAAVPSIVFGLLGLAVFINFFGLPRSAPLVGGMVLSLMTLPTVIISSRAALKAVPPSIREAALGVGASKTQTVFHHVLPLALPGILTGSIIGLAQALGETAPLLMIGMVAFIADAPTLAPGGLTEPATVMPVQIFLWSDGAERAFEARTAAAIIILLALMIAFNAFAVFLRRRFETRW